ncbi:MAG: S41 family peptidase [Phycisphaeraceae bacterium]|nr:S41 family peptidase [Phycisphaeraceae bacterium]
MKLMKLVGTTAAAALLACGPGALAQVTTPAPPTFSSVEGWGKALWLAADRGDSAGFEALLRELPESADGSLRQSVEQFRKTLRDRDAERERQHTEAHAKLVEQLEGEPTAQRVSQALVHCVHLLEISPTKAEVFGDDAVRRAVQTAERLAHAAEAEGDWLTANELFYRLNTLYEDEGTYRADIDRQNERLSMIQLYAPEELWKMRNAHEIAEGSDPLPPYQPVNETYEDAIAGISFTMVDSALRQSAEGHVERVDAREMILDGLDAVEMLLTTPELSRALPVLASKEAQDVLLGEVRRERLEINDFSRPVDSTRIRRSLQSIQLAARQVPGLAPEMVLREFAQGAMGALDEFSAIIWPDEVRRFERNTSGNYAGVGIQIQLDEDRKIQVVTPLDDTPAYRADIRTNDRIIAVDGVSTEGMSINQAAERITGPVGRTVTLTIERPITAEDGSTSTTVVDVPVRREQIVVRTTKGWHRHDADSGWDWMIDPERGIGYVRLTQFTESSTIEMRRAIGEMKTQGLNGLIFDLRFNPGGLMDQAVSVANLFVPGGNIVSTADGRGQNVSGWRRAHPDGEMVADIPVVILTNQSSASASEIVAGAIQDHARDGEIDAMILGRRTFGKGSVQNVWNLPGGMASMKLTRNYYRLPSGRLIHKRPGVPGWGVAPDCEVDMLPSQTLESVLLRRDADSLPQVAAGAPDPDRPDPDRILEEGLDPQLHAALLLLQARVSSQALTRLAP